MAKKKEDNAPVPEKCFTLTVDGKTYGPFLDKHRKETVRLEHLAGIELEIVFLESGWIAFTPPLPRKKKDVSAPLLEGLGFIPIPRARRV